MKIGPINSEPIYKHTTRQATGRSHPRRETVKAGKLGANCKKGVCGGCYVLSCSCWCHGATK